MSPLVRRVSYFVLAGTNVAWGALFYAVHMTGAGLSHVCAGVVVGMLAMDDFRRGAK